MANLKDLIVNGSARVLGTLYAPDIRDTSRITEFIVGSQTATTGSWTGVTKDNSLYDGKNINYFLPYAGSGNASLNLTLANGTTTGAKPVYLSGTSYVTTHYAANSCINMTYNATKGAWFVNADRDANDNTYDRVKNSNNIYAVAACTNGKLIVGTSAGYKDIAASVTFDIDYPILYCGTAAEATKTTANTYLTFPGVNLQTTKASWTGTQWSVVYLVGTLSNRTFTIDSTVFTTTVPSTQDNKVYIPIGVLYSTYQCYFTSCKDMYSYRDGSFQRVGAKYVQGSTIQPIYFDSNGQPQNTTYTLAKSVPADANFSNTTYSAGTGLSLSGTTFNHSNSITGATAGQTTASSGSTLQVPYVTYDSTGHVTAAGTHTHTVTGFQATSTAVTHTANTAVGSTVKPVYIATNGAATALNATVGNTITPVYLNSGAITALSYTIAKSVPSNAVFTDTTYSGSDGITLSGTTFKHSNSVTSGTAGQSTASSGSTLQVPYVTYDANGHITAKGTHTHTVTGFAASSHNQASSSINAMTGYAKASASAAISTTDSLNTAIGKLEYKIDNGGGGNVKVSNMNGSSITPTNPTASVAVDKTANTITVKGQTWEDGDNDFATAVLANVASTSTITVTIVTYSNVRAYSYNSHYYSRDTLEQLDS